MKICFIASQTSVHTLRWLKAFADRGHEMHIISFSPIKIKGVIVHSLNAKFSFGILSKISPVLPTLLDLRFIPKIKKILNKIKPDVIHGHYLTCYAFFATCTGFHPLVVSAWGSDIATDPDKSWFLKLIVKYVFKKADLIHVGDEPAKKRVFELGCDAQKIFIQPWGIDISKFSLNTKNQFIKEKLHINNNYLVINTRTLDNKKYHIDILIKAIPLVLKKINNIKFIFVASGSSKQELKQLANKLKIQNQVIFLGGVPNQKIPFYLNSADIYVDTYFPENNKAGSGMSLSTMEAMACQLPQIIPQIPSIIESGDWFQGLTYQPGNSKDLAEKIIYLLKNKELRKKIGKKSREIALELFDLNKNMNDWQIAYNNLIKKSI
jgi:glycosyltransferase involved in cell wall biosynthesis